MNFLILFIACTVVNVIISTTKSLVTVQGKKFPAAIINALAAGFYTYIVVLTANGGIDTIWKMIITAICNFLGVYIVKLIQEKTKPERLWKIEATVKHAAADKTLAALDKNNIPHNYIDITKYTVINCYCATKNESRIVKQILSENDARYFVNETKIL